MKGKLITFEGIEGCGKSTQATLLQNFFESHQISSIISREPGGTPLGNQIRALLLKEKMSHLSELFLFLADRNQHIHETIKPAIEEGKIVLLDRYYHSTYAYQSAGRNLPLKEIRLLNEQAIEGFHPDITFFIDVPVEVGFERKKTASMNLDRIELEDQEFHERVRQAFLSFTQSEVNFIRLDGTGAPERIHKEVIDKLKRLKIVNGL